MSETNPAVGGGSDGRTLRTGREALETAKALLRPPVYRVYLTLEHHRYHRYLRRRLGPYVMPMELGPPAPKQLILKTAELDEKSFEQGFRAGSARAEKHFVLGIQTLRL